MLTEISILQVFAAVQTSVTLNAVHDGVGEKINLLSPGEADKALKVLNSSVYNRGLTASAC